MKFSKYIFNTKLLFNKYLTIIISCIFLVSWSGCTQQKDAGAASEISITRQAANTLTDQEKEGGWRLLFDGETTEGWRQVYEQEFPGGGWIVEEGALIVLESDGRHGGSGGGSIVTEEQFSDFVLTLDVRLSEGANSGIKYFVVENEEFFQGDPEGPSGRGIGLEYQILDDMHHPDAKNGVNGNRTMASLYDLIPAAKNRKVNPPGEWNHVRLVSDGPHVEHWLNGEKVLEYERGSDSFRALVDKSKYNGYENFGEAPAGYILLQDHGNRVAYKNIKIREL